MSRKILVIEDNKDLAHLLKIHLQDMSYDTVLAFDGIKGLEHVKTSKYDLVILDIMLPGMDGIEICRHIREQGDYTPVMMLTSKDSELDRVLGLEIGADDYITKPFSIRELMARVKAMFRRMDEFSSKVDDTTKSIIIDGLIIEPQKRSVTLKGRNIDLTAKEFDLLYHFASQPGVVFTRSQLLDLVWGYGHDGYEHTVNSHINRLRAKIEEDPTQPQYILTVWGVGYKFREP